MKGGSSFETLMTGNFATDFTKRLFRDAYTVQIRNYDNLRYGGGFAVALRQWFKDLLAVSISKVGLATTRYDPGWFDFIAENLEAFNSTFQLLGDAKSKEVMLTVLAYRVLGGRHVKMLRNDEAFWQNHSAADTKYATNGSTRSVWNARWRLKEYTIPFAGASVTFNAHALHVLHTFLLKQYRYQNGPVTVSAKIGDVVMDCGGCYGDTALYFAALVGESGKVVAFEFMPENLSILKSNLSKNPELQKRVTIVNKPVWSRSGTKFAIESDGPGSRISSGGTIGNKTEIETISIDDTATAECLPRVDFIKMDIEGAEFEALKGAVEVIKHYKPDLAISLYHKKEDWITIPQWLSSLNLGYKFYLDHFTIHSEETVLFASARVRA